MMEIKPIRKNLNNGLIKTAFSIIVALLLLTYFGIDIEQVVKSDLFRKNVKYSWTTAKSVWINYIYDPIFNKNADTDKDTANDNDETIATSTLLRINL